MGIVDAADLGTILGVWAHPDDETWLSAGIMADAAAAGNRVGCITATRGELGSQDLERWPVETLGEVRERELLASLAILGVTEHWWLGYPDGGCDEVERSAAVAQIVAVIEQVRPDSVLTFGPDGMTGHRDHIVVGSWAEEAFKLAAPPGARLYHASHTPGWAERFVPIMEPHDVFMAPGTPPIRPREEMAIDFSCSPATIEVKARAIAEHVSQIEGLRAILGEDSWHEGLIEEAFVLGLER